MTLMVARVAYLAVYSVWHLALAVLSARKVSRPGAGAASDHGRGACPDGASAAPYVLWLLLISPTPATLSATRALHPRPGRRIRIVVIDDRGEQQAPAHADLLCLTVPPGLDRGRMLDRVYRFARDRSRADGEDPTHVVVGLIDRDSRPGEGLVDGLWRAFADAAVGAVQGRVATAASGVGGSVHWHEVAVLASAGHRLRDRRGRAPRGVNGAFVRLSELARRSVLVRHDPRVAVVVGEPRPYGLVRQGRRCMPDHHPEPQPADGAAAARRRPDTPVFVDATGRRRRRVWLIAYGFSVAGILYLAVFGYAVVGTPVRPYADELHPHPATRDELDDRRYQLHEDPTQPPSPPQPPADAEPLITVELSTRDGWRPGPASPRSSTATLESTLPPAVPAPPATAGPPTPNASPPGPAAKPSKPAPPPASGSTPPTAPPRAGPPGHAPVAPAELRPATPPPPPAGSRRETTVAEGS